MVVELKITAVEDTLFWVGQGCVLLFGNARVVETSRVLGNCEDGKQNVHEADTNRFTIIFRVIFNIDAVWLGRC